MSQPEIAMAPGRILVVDDDEAVRRVFAEVLRLEGYAVQTAASAADALRACGIAESTWPSYAKALASLQASEVIRER